MDKNIKKIIQECQKGNNEEFVYIYDAYVKKIYNFIYYKTNHKETAEDLTSKTFFKALKSINTFSLDTENFNAWIYRIARNLVIDYYRGKKDDDSIEDYFGLDSGGDIEVDIDNKAKLEIVKKYLGKLKAEHREIIILRVWDELSYEEISEIMGKSEDSCRMMFSRVIKKLRNDLPLALLIIILNI